MNVLRSSCQFVIKVQKVNAANTGYRFIRRSWAPTLKEITRRKDKLGPQPEQPRSGFIEWNFESELYAFNSRLSEKFNLELLSQAFTHNSYILKEEQKQRQVGIDDPQLHYYDNRQFILDGKSLTSKIVEAYLSSAMPRTPAECISAFKDYLLSEEVLASRASLLGCKDIILTEEYPPSNQTLANTFFALVAALAKSTDEIHTAKFIRDFLITTLAEKDLNELYCPENPIEILNQVLTNDGKDPVEPRIISQTGVNTFLPCYQIGLFSNKQFISSATESTIEDAVKVAALNALSKLFGFADSSNPMKYNLDVDPSKQIKNLTILNWCTQNVKQLMQKN
ncbi:39S ribosomal protein L44, mitochondrial [Microplitis demolitor]|uniref:39S ribosomal protein L44, mitochondrial n=1 Tax=Microplitis demolitor TaxID=69319 RepID=UPI0004CCAD26|nr:39S ribosomal protein L44, mitochondrial [Microplitis demolitor]